MPLVCYIIRVFDITKYEESMDLSYLDKIILGNPLKAYGAVLVIFFGAVFVLYIVRKIIFSRFRRITEKTGNKIDNFVMDNLERFGIPIVYIITAYYLLTSTLTIDGRISRAIYAVFLALIILYAVRFVKSIFRFSLIQYWMVKEGKEREEADTNVKGISTFVSLIIWTIAFVFYIDNMGFKISGIMAGIGIGGVTLALASQAILGDLFSYFVIFFDRPFEIGDFIKVDEKLGVIEKIGIKTTRVKSLDGEQLVFSNTDLTKTRLHNYKKMLERRVGFKLGVTYQTEYDKLKNIPLMLKEIISSFENVRFDRAHFFSYGESSLDFEIVYYVYSPDYNVYMDIQQNINLNLFKRFGKEGIEFAYPTTTVFVEKG